MPLFWRTSSARLSVLSREDASPSLTLLSALLGLVGVADLCGKERARRREREGESGVEGEGDGRLKGEMIR